MTCHWIDQHSFQRKQAVLGSRRIKGCYSFDVVAKEIEGIHWDFQIENKVLRTTTDNGSNFVKAFKYVCMMSLLLFLESCECKRRNFLKLNWGEW